MNLKVLLPDSVALEVETDRISAEAQNGAFTLLPRHIDFVTALVPGILAYADAEGDGTAYLAVDEGILVKQGAEVRVSTRRAVHGPLERLQETVETELKVIDDRERAMRTASAKIEASFVRRFVEIEGA